MSATVLIVEDEADIMMLERIALERGGDRVLTAASAEEALVILDREQPDLLVLDLRLPGMDGWGLLDHLREAGRLWSLTVVIISADASTDVETRATAFGCGARLTKPFSVEDLRRMVDGLLAASQPSPPV